MKNNNSYICKRLWPAARSLYVQAVVFVLCLLFFFFAGCSARVSDEAIYEKERLYPADTILSSEKQLEVSFETMIEDLSSSPIVYVGETHTSGIDHEIQLKILIALHRANPDIAVGMEMFARPYQDVLWQWTKQKVSEKKFIQNTHWYANWRYDFSLYRDLLSYIRKNGIFLIGLHIEFHIPAKIAAGGIDSLLPYQKKQIPDRMEFDDTGHRQYMKNVYENHSNHVTTRYEFENFYAAQVVRDEVMAETVSRFVKDHQMIVFAGKGHIVQPPGIPERAFSRTGLDYRRVKPHPKDKPVDFSEADYIWIRPSGCSP